MYKKQLLILLLIILFIINLCNKNKEFFSNYNNYIENNITICMKTIYRKNLLKENLKNIRNRFNNIKIIIADDSDNIYKKEIKKLIEKYLDNNLKYLELTFDSGLSKGRNECVKNVNTEFIILSDDSRTINCDKNIIYKLLTFLKENKNYNIITGYCPERVDDRRRGSRIEKTKNNIKFKNLKLYFINFGINCFLVRTKFLKKYKWDEKLKLGEHEKYFNILNKNKEKILFCKEFVFKQFGGDLYKYDKNGAALRKRAVEFKKKYEC